MNSSTESDLIGLRREAGIDHICVVPLREAHGFEACFAAVGSDFDLPKAHATALHLIGIYALAQLRNFSKLPRPMLQELTEREREVLTWIAQGKSAWEIGEILGISKRTVDEHTQTALHKLGAVNRVQAVVIALQNQLLNV